MSKSKSTDTLIRLTHGESVESIELKSRIDLLTNMLTHPTSSKRNTYVASHLYDQKGNFNTGRWEYQAVGVAAITSVPIIVVAGATQAALAAGMIEFGNGIMLASAGMIAAEALIIGGTNAYMTLKGSKMNNQIKKDLISNLQSLGYQITFDNEPLKESVDSYKTNNERLLEGEVISTNDNKYIHLIEEDEFVSKVSNLINQILQNPYPRYEDDIAELKGLAVDWMAINIREYKRSGKRLDNSCAPSYLYEAYESEILSKINKTLKKVSK
jgi:Txe/YoeB family toxin of Txe-Axe toxin-antitoxin module